MNLDIYTVKTFVVYFILHGINLEFYNSYLKEVLVNFQSVVGTQM